MQHFQEFLTECTHKCDLIEFEIISPHKVFIDVYERQNGSLAIPLKKKILNNLILFEKFFH